MVKEKKRTDKKSDKSARSPSSPSDFTESVKLDSNVAPNAPASNQALEVLKEPLGDVHGESQISQDTLHYEESVLTELIVER